MARTHKSLKKIKRLALLMLITIVLGITATYAWFSSQRDVEVSGMKLNVEVAENMQISLDGEEWGQTITIGNMRQFYGTYAGTETFKVYQAKNGDNTNYVPTELKPVSTVGEVANGKLRFMAGEIEVGATGKSALNATACSEDDLTSNATVETKESGNMLHPYLAFDMYLKNLSAKEEGDKLVLNLGSKLWVDRVTEETQEGVGKLNTGLENCVRVGFVTYKNTADITEEGENIRALTPDASDTDKATASIWEPNDLEHIQEVITNSGRGVTANTTMPTYGVKYSSTAVTVDDIESTTDTKLGLQNTMKPTYNRTGTRVLQNLIDTAGTEVILKPNQITKVRVYIWLEGQDVDCINTASTGDRLQATIRLTKPQNTDRGNNTYIGGNSEEGSGSGSDPTPTPETYITAATLKVEDYGGTVTNYSASNGASVGWRIFHSDGGNIYLIADDYIENQYKPAGKGGTTYLGTNGTYGADLNAYQDYAGTEDISSTLKTKLLSQYTYTSAEENAKATAYLLDTNVWSGFKDNSGYAEYAIGGPTLELFANSYNKTHPYKTIQTQANATGYQLKWNTDTNYGNGVSGLSTSEGLYVISDVYGGSYGIWLASPSAGGAAGLARVSYSGAVNWNVHTFASGSMRPIVALKSSTKIEKQEDGTYKIIP